MFNLHSHSIYSHDGTYTVDELCQSAIDNGVKCLAITDHADLILYKQREVYSNISNCVKAVLEAKKKYEGKLKVLLGVELGEEYKEPSLANEIRSLGNYDIILSSIHMLRELGPDFDIAHADIPIWSKAKITSFLKLYYNRILKTVETGDFDVLSHLTYPFRYVNLKYKVDCDETIVDEEIVKILKLLIKRKKALELNTSTSDLDYFVPNERILKIYKNLGGKLITIGADTHLTKDVTKGLKEGEELLKKCGFNEYYYYELRKPIIAKKL